MPPSRLSTILGSRLGLTTCMASNSAEVVEKKRIGAHGVHTFLVAAHYVADGQAQRAANGGHDAAQVRIPGVEDPLVLVLVAWMPRAGSTSSARLLTMPQCARCGAVCVCVCPASALQAHSHAGLGPRAAAESLARTPCFGSAFPP